MKLKDFFKNQNPQVLESEVMASSALFRSGLRTLSDLNARGLRQEFNFKFTDLDENEDISFLFQEESFKHALKELDTAFLKYVQSRNVERVYTRCFENNGLSLNFNSIHDYLASPRITIFANEFVHKFSGDYRSFTKTSALRQNEVFGVVGLEGDIKYGLSHSFKQEASDFYITLVLNCDLSKVRFEKSAFFIDELSFIL
ncbi:hypothetical protein [Bdellovibrio sp. BCCA]|uniref:hypothetical protein n=1 Tax=Bdellovibrio sp. BCCA TaxID=3136281 RepID=UPI0030F2862F